MRKLRLGPVYAAIVAVISSTLTLPEPASTGIRFGVASDAPAPEAGGAPRIEAPVVGATVIDFDDVAQPCAFLEVVALREEYAALGIHFEGTSGPNDGGAIVDECSGFGITGYSAPNILAFANLAVLMDGGVPQPPELITFDFPVARFQINAGVGGAVTGSVTIEARDSGGAIVDTSTITVAPGMQTLSVTGDDIRTIEVTSTAWAFAMDDLAFVEAGVPTLPLPALVLLGLVLSILILFAGRRLHRSRDPAAAGFVPVPELPSR